MLMTIYECKLFYICILSYIFLMIKFYLYFLYIGGFLEYVVNTHGSWFLMKKRPPGSQIPPCLEVNTCWPRTIGSTTLL